MEKNNLKVLRGGLLDSADTSRKVFVTAYVTNTRLMGVLAMYVHFELPDNETLSEIHQFFYFDAEEYGFETYESVLGDDRELIKELDQSLMGGLGGEKIQVSLKEASYLLQQYAAFNQKHQLPMPEGIEEYGFLLDDEITLTEAEQHALMCKECVTISSDYELINYFLMRCFGKDFSAASFLAEENCELELFPDFEGGAFCKNTVDEGESPGSYMNESLIETDSNYYIAVTNVTVRDGKVCAYEKISSFKVSPAEAAMLLSRSEYISVYEMLCEPEEFNRNTTHLTSGAMITNHEIGVLYMMFHPNNKHVDRKDYRLNEDVLGMFFVSNSGQLITAAYTIKDIHNLEIQLATCALGRKLIPVSRYEFQEPVLYEFIQSGFDDFEIFVEAIKTGEE